MSTNNEDLDVVISSINIERIVKELEEEKEKTQQFLKNKTYVDVMDSWINRVEPFGSSIFSDMDSEDWNNYDDMTFSFLQDTAHEIHHFKEDVVIKYQGIYITLSELHGQGCFRSVSLSFVEDGNYIPFELIEEYLLTGSKPKRYHALDTVHKGLMAVKAIKGDIGMVDSEGFYIDDVWDYLLENLS